MTTTREILGQYAEILSRAGVDSPRLSAEILLAATMGLEREALLKAMIMTPETLPSPEQVAAADALVARRRQGEPVAYITGVKEFYGRPFRVTPATLIPRPDTETLVDAALAFAAGYKAPATDIPSFIDLGTGSGCIAVTLALELPSWRGMAVDNSTPALMTARENASSLGAGNLRFMQGDFTTALFPPETFAMVVSNPPYVSEGEYAGLSREVSAYEPKSALVPGEREAADGFEDLFSVMSAAKDLLRDGGALFMEMGHTQGDMLLRHAKALPEWRGCRVIRDLAGLSRVFAAVRSERERM